MLVTSPHRIISGIRRRYTRKPRAHFLHIRKTGGDGVKAALWPAEFSGHYHLVFHRHRVTLSEVPEGEPFFFGVRDPTSRFVSGFYSRQRQGAPRHNQPWGPGEEAIFKRFLTANQLAVALSSSDRDERAAAQTAMKTIRHFRSYWEWFLEKDYFIRRSSDLLMILFQENLNDDFEILAGRLGVTASLPKNDVTAHRNPSTVDKRLTDVAVENLRSWYRSDFEFLDLCRRLRFGTSEAKGST